MLRAHGSLRHQWRRTIAAWQQLHQNEDEQWCQVECLQLVVLFDAVED